MVENAMSLQSVQLNKLMQIAGSDARQRRALLLRDLSNERRKAAKKASRALSAADEGDDSGGGDFHLPFWADVKKHVSGELDLRASTIERIQGNWRRERLYPQLAAGFLKWWEEKRRWKNEPSATNT